MNENTALNISWGAIFKVCVAIIFLYILFLIKDIIIWFIFALIIGILFNFLIDLLEQKRIPRIISTFLLYFGIVAVFSFFVYKTAPVFLLEIKDFSRNLPEYLQKMSPLLGKLGIEAFKTSENLTSTLQDTLVRASQSIFSALFALFGGALSASFVIFLAFFISLERNFGEKILKTISSPKNRDYILDLWQRSKQKISGWFISRVTGALFILVTTYLILSILNIEYSFVLSLMAGILDFVPIVGPMIAGFAIALIAAFNSLFQAGFVIIAFSITQFLENNLLIPLLFKKLSGVPPVLVLMALAIGARLWGFLGAILAIPLAGVVFEILKDYSLKAKKEISEIL